MKTKINKSSSHPLSHISYMSSKYLNFKIIFNRNRKTEKYIKIILNENNKVIFILSQSQENTLKIKIGRNTSRHSGILLNNIRKNKLKFNENKKFKFISFDDIYCAEMFLIDFKTFVKYRKNVFVKFKNNRYFS